MARTTRSQAAAQEEREEGLADLQNDELEWTWIHRQEGEVSAKLSTGLGTSASESNFDVNSDTLNPSTIIGARYGRFECRIGDSVLLRAEGLNETWIAIIGGFTLDEDGDKAAEFLWFTHEREIRNTRKKRNDFFPNEVYISQSTDVNPLTSICSKCDIMSKSQYDVVYPKGKVPRSSPKYGKVFICRRGCNTRSTNYTPEFNWEELYDKYKTTRSLLEYVQHATQNQQSTRRKRKDKSPSGRAPSTQHNINSIDNGSNEDVHRSSDDEDSTTDEDDDDNDYENCLETPSTPRKRGKPQRKTPCTPASSRKKGVKRALEFTPLQTRYLPAIASLDISPFQKARNQLHVAAVPSSLPCRETEFNDVYFHLHKAISNNTSNCIYISGTPGTGKTATVREVIARLEDAVISDELDDFIFVEINGMKITDPHHSYALLWEALKGDRVSSSQALDLLEREFNFPNPRRVPCVVLMDELDQLVTKSQSVMYNFFNWPALRHSRLIVLAVANTMDLPERTLSNKISSRLGLTRITFPGYNHEQLASIIQSRLEGVPGDIVDSDAVQFASRKVAAVSGDARRALDICRRAVELAEADHTAMQSLTASPSKRSGGQKNGRVTIPVIRRAINEATSNPIQVYLRSLALIPKLLLVTLCVRIHRSGIGETTFGEVLDELALLLKQDPGRWNDDLLGAPLQSAREQNNSWSLGDAVSSPITSTSDFVPVRLIDVGHAAVSLTAAGLVVLESLRVERPSKIRLAVADDEIKMAFHDDSEVKQLGLNL